MKTKINKLISLILTTIMILLLLPLEHVSALSILKWIANKPLSYDSIYYYKPVGKWFVYNYDEDDFYSEKVNIIDEYGNEVLSKMYDEILIVSDDAYLVQNNETIMSVDKDGNVIKELPDKTTEWNQDINEAGYCLIKQEGIDGFINYGIADVYGNIKIPCKYSTVKYISDDLISVKNNDGLMGILDINGNIKVPFKYKYNDYYDGYISDDIIVVTDIDDNYGIIDIEDNVVMPCRYRGITYISNDIIIARDENDNMGVVDINGNVKVSFKYKGCMHIYDNLIRVVDHNNNYGIVDISENIILPVEYDNISFIDTRNYTYVFAKNKEGQGKIVNIKTGYVFSGYYNDVRYISDEYIAIKGNGWGIIDANQNAIISALHEDLNYISNDVIIAVDGNYNCGIIDMYGKTKIPIIYKDIEYVSDDIIVAKDKNYNCGVIDIYGNVKIPFKYNDVTYISDDFIVVSDFNGNYGIIDINGNTILPMEYSDVVCDTDCKVIAVEDKDNKWHMLAVEELTPQPQDEFDLYIGNQYASVWGEIKTNDVSPIARNNRTLLPARFVAETLGAQVSWNAMEQKVTVEKGDIKIEFVLDSNIAYLNGVAQNMDSTVIGENGRTFVPVRFLAENLGAVVNWVPETKKVVIKRN